MQAAGDLTNDIEPGHAGADRLRLSVHDLPAAASLTEAWRVLAERPVADNAFFQRGFVLAAAGHIASEDVSIAAVSTAQGQLLALAPFTRIRLGRVIPAARIWSHNYGPLGVPLVDPTRAAAALASLVRGLPPRRGALVLPDLPLEGAIAALIKRIATNDARPLAIVDAGDRAVARRETWAGASALPRRRRKELARQARRLAEGGELVWKTALTTEDVRADFARFLALEAAGWKGQRGTALASTTEAAQFAREAVFSRTTPGSVRIDSLNVGARAVAMVVSFVEGRTMFAWKTAYREDVAQLSPGVQLMLGMPERVFADAGVDVIDSLAQPDTPMINRLWPDRMAIGTMIVGPPGGSVAFRVGVAAAVMETSARLAARRLRRRLFGR